MQRDTRGDNSHKRKNTFINKSTWAISRVTINKNFGEVEKVLWWVYGIAEVGKVDSTRRTFEERLDPPGKRFK